MWFFCAFSTYAQLSSLLLRAEGMSVHIRYHETSEIRNAPNGRERG